MNYMNWLLKLLGLVPIIANGIQNLHTDKTVGTKIQMAQDSLSLAVQGAAALLPAEHTDTINKVGAIASQAMSETVTALHNAGPSPSTI